MIITEDRFRRLKEILSSRRRKRLYRKGFRSSAVVLINHKNKDKIHLLFTLRSHKVRHHQQQVSFPGGAREKGEGLMRCAIRETREELNISIKREEVIGLLDDILTISRFKVTPFVIFSRREDILRDIRPSDEISQVIDVPLDYLLEHPPRIEDMQFGRQKIRQYFYNYQEYIIWGATGRILRQYLEILSLSLNAKYFP